MHRSIFLQEDIFMHYNGNCVSLSKVILYAPATKNRNISRKDALNHSHRAMHWHYMLRWNKELNNIFLRNKFKY